MGVSYQIVALLKIFMNFTKYNVAPPRCAAGWRRRVFFKQAMPLTYPEAACDQTPVELENICLEFLRISRERGQTVTGPTLVTLAREEAKRLGIPEFKVSDAWLTKFKTRHGLKRCTFWVK